MLDRQKDHVQNVQDFCEGLQYAYMSHFYANYTSIFLKSDLTFEDLPASAFEAIRNLPSFRRHVEGLLERGAASHARSLLDSNEELFQTIQSQLTQGQAALALLSRAVQALLTIRAALQMSPNVRVASLWTRAALGELGASPLLRESMLFIKKLSSDKFAQLLAAMTGLQGDHFNIDIDSLQDELDELTTNNDTSGPLRTQYDVRNDSMRTTVVAQKVLLSKHKAALSEQDRAYSDLVGQFHDALELYFTAAFTNPHNLCLSEILIYDLKSPHTEVFQPRPRFAIERALATPHDYLGCDCCGGNDDAEAALSASQPATAIVYQLYLEAGSLTNVTDLWSAFNAIVGEADAEDDSKTMSVMLFLDTSAVLTTNRALFQRALSELKYLGLLKPSRKKTDHVAKTMWKGL